MVIFDSSTLILLAKTDLLRLISNEFKIVITDEIKKEVLHKQTFDSKMIEQLIIENKIDYKKNQISLGTLAKNFDKSISETIDIFADLGIESQISYDDFLKGLENLK